MAFRTLFRLFTFWLFRFEFRICREFPTGDIRTAAISSIKTAASMVIMYIANAITIAFAFMIMVMVVIMIVVVIMFMVMIVVVIVIVVTRCRFIIWKFWPFWPKI